MIRLSAKAAQKKTTPTRMIAGAVENTVYDFSFSESSKTTYSNSLNWSNLFLNFHLIFLSTKRSDF